MTTDTTLVIFSLVACAAVLTWMVAPGVYDRMEMQVEGVGTREVVVPGTFRYVERDDRSAAGTLRSDGKVE